MARDYEDQPEDFASPVASLMVDVQSLAVEVQSLDRVVASFARLMRTTTQNLTRFNQTVLRSIQTATSSPGFSGAPRTATGQVQSNAVITALTAALGANTAATAAMAASIAANTATLRSVSLFSGVTAASAVTRAAASGGVAGGAAVPPRLSSSPQVAPVAATSAPQVPASPPPRRTRRSEEEIAASETPEQTRKRHDNNAKRRQRDDQARRERKKRWDESIPLERETEVPNVPLERVSDTPGVPLQPTTGRPPNVPLQPTGGKDVEDEIARLQLEFQKSEEAYKHDRLDKLDKKYEKAKEELRKRNATQEEFDELALKDQKSREISERSAAQHAEKRRKAHEEQVASLRAGAAATPQPTVTPPVQSQTPQTAANAAGATPPVPSQTPTGPVPAPPGRGGAAGGRPPGGPAGGQPSSGGSSGRSGPQWNALISALVANTAATNLNTRATLLLARVAVVMARPGGSMGPNVNVPTPPKLPSDTESPGMGNVTAALNQVQAATAAATTAIMGFIAIGDASTFSTFMGSVKALSAELGEVFSPVLKDVTKTLYEWADAVNAWDDNTKSTVATIGKYVIGIGLLVTTLRTLGVTTIATRVAVLAFNAIWAVSPLGAVITTVATLTAAVYALGEAFGWWGGKTEDAARKASQSLQQAREAADSIKTPKAPGPGDLGAVETPKEKSLEALLGKLPADIRPGIVEAAKTAKPEEVTKAIQVAVTSTQAKLTEERAKLFQEAAKSEEENRAREADFNKRQSIVQESRAQMDKAFKEQRESFRRRFQDETYSGEIPKFVIRDGAQTPTPQFEKMAEQVKAIMAETEKRAAAAGVKLTPEDIKAAASVRIIDQGLGGFQGAVPRPLSDVYGEKGPQAPKVEADTTRIRELTTVIELLQEISRKAGAEGIGPGSRLPEEDNPQSRIRAESTRLIGQLTAEQQKRFQNVSMIDRASVAQQLSKENQLEKVKAEQELQKLRGPQPLTSLERHQNLMVSLAEAMKGNQTKENIEKAEQKFIADSEKLPPIDPAEYRKMLRALSQPFDPNSPLFRRAEMRTPDADDPRVKAAEARIQEIEDNNTNLAALNDTLREVQPTFKELMQKLPDAVAFKIESAKTPEQKLKTIQEIAAQAQSDLVTERKAALRLAEEDKQQARAAGIVASVQEALEEVFQQQQKEYAGRKGIPFKPGDLQLMAGTEPEAVRAMAASKQAIAEAREMLKQAGLSVDEARLKEALQPGTLGRDGALLLKTQGLQGEPKAPEAVASANKLEQFISVLRQMAQVGPPGMRSIPGRPGLPGDKEHPQDIVMPGGIKARYTDAVSFRESVQLAALNDRATEVDLARRQLEQLLKHEQLLRGVVDYQSQLVDALRRLQPAVGR